MTAAELSQHQTQQNTLSSPGANSPEKTKEKKMTRGTLAATAALITLAFTTPSLAQGGCWKSTDGTKPYGYAIECAAPAGKAKGANATRANAMQQVSVNAGGPGQCWKGTDSTKSYYGYWHACK
jgi:hypothetical protein